jgi:hypothetical protein
MNKFTLAILALISFMLLSCDTEKKSTLMNENEPSRVELKLNEKGNYRLYVNGEEYYINGAGLEFGNIAKLAEHGGNSFRTWRTNNGRQSGKEVLDQAYENGLMVLMGLEIARERHGFDYNNEELVQEQKEAIRKEILEYKDHPALLAWGIGNELNLRYTNKKVWDAVNDIAKMIHEIDGNHPTTTMLAGIYKPEVDYIETNCTDLDFLSVQMYGDIINLQKRLDEAGYDGPYVVTEWGATGHWEVNKTEWGAPIEQNSAEKAASIKTKYEQGILVDSARCLGSYVFLWGQKQERTPTWYGLYTENGEETPAIDVMHYFWEGNKWPENRAPELVAVTLDGKEAEESIRVSAGNEMVLTYQVADNEGDSLSWRFEVLKEATVLRDGGDPEPRPETIKNLVIESAFGKVTFSAPETSGAYRAFLYVLDGNNHAATVNIPFFVD